MIAVSKAIHTFRFGKIDPSQFNQELKEMYNWSNVAERTEKVYAAVYQTRNSPLIERLRRYYGCGVYAGKIFCMVIALDYLIWKYLEWLFPFDSIERAQAFPYLKYRSFFNNNSDTNHRSSYLKENTIISQVLVEEDEGESEEISYS